MNLLLIALVLASEPVAAESAPEAASAPAVTEAAPAAKVAPDPTVSAVRNIQKRLLYNRLGEYYSDGKKLELGFLLGKAEPIFSAYPDSLEALRSARKYVIAGELLSGLGIGLLVAELVIIATGNPATINRPLLWGLLAGGLVLNLTGTILSIVGVKKFQEAVNRYNFNLMNDQLPPDQRFDVNPLVSRRERLTAPALPLIALAF